MTPEQLDEIEKVAATWLGKEKDFYATDRDAAMHQFLIAMRDAALPLVKALREALARCETLRELADEKAHDAGLYARRMGQAQESRSKAWAEVERLKGIVEVYDDRFATLNDEKNKEIQRLRAELEQVRAKNGSLADRIEKADSELRDAWRAEDRLRSTLRLLWGHANNAWIPRDCRNAVEAALKEDE